MCENSGLAQDCCQCHDEYTLPASSAGAQLPAQRIDCRRTRARRSARGAGAGVAADGQQRGADRAQPHRHVVHRPYLDDRHSPRSAPCSGSCRRRVGARRSRHGRADARGASTTARAATRARSQAVWTALWATLCAAPLFVLVGAAGHADSARRLASTPASSSSRARSGCRAFRAARSVGAAVWAVLGFFNGIGRPRVTLLVTAITALANVPLNAAVHFRPRAGESPAPAGPPRLRRLLGLLLALAIFLRARYRARYRSHLTWRPHCAPSGRSSCGSGLPTGLLPAADLLGFAIFQMMQVRLGTRSMARRPRWS